MQLTLGRLTALRVTRALRSGTAGGYPTARCDLLAPDPSPAQRFTRAALDLPRLGALAADAPGRDLDVTVSLPSQRVRMRGMSCRTMSAALPEGSFTNLGNGLAISGPELLFVELARVLDRPQHVLLGMELCGTFSRDPLDPRDGTVTFAAEPLTTVGRIERFCGQAKGLWGVQEALDSLAFVRDNAWSPMEAVLATMLLLPLYELGYSFPDLTLNPRELTAEELGAGVVEHARVPDIVMGGSSVGLNYDGGIHLDLDSIATAAAQAARPAADALPEAGTRAAAGVVQVTGQDVEAAKRSVREKVVDDLRRNRELAASGLTVLPVTKEDLYERGGLDRVVRQLIAIARRDGVDFSQQQSFMASPAICRGRQKLLWSMLPGRQGRYYGRLLAEKRKRMFVPVVYDYEVRMYGAGDEATEPDAADAAGASTGSDAADALGAGLTATSSD